MRSPRQVAEELRERAKGEEPAVTALLTEITGETGGRLVGLQNRIKGLRRLEDKVAERQRRAARLGRPSLAERAGEDIGDALRYTVVFGTEDYADGYLAVLIALEAEAIRVVGVRNTWGGGPYRGLNVTFLAAGLAFEVQFHTADSFRLNGMTRTMCEERRNPQTSPARREQLVEESVRLLDDLEVPPGADELR